MIILDSQQQDKEFMESTEETASIFNSISSHRMHSFSDQSSAYLTLSKRNKGNENNKPLCSEFTAQYSRGRIERNIESVWEHRQPDGGKFKTCSGSSSLAIA